MDVRQVLKKEVVILTEENRKDYVPSPVFLMCKPFDWMKVYSASEHGSFVVFFPQPYWLV